MVGSHFFPISCVMQLRLHDRSLAYPTKRQLRFLGIMKSKDYQYIPKNKVHDSYVELGSWESMFILGIVIVIYGFIPVQWREDFPFCETFTGNASLLWPKSTA